MVNIENCHFRLKGTGRLFMHNRYIHYVWINSLAKVVKCRLEYFQLLAVCAAGRAGRGEELPQQTPPTPGHTCPAPGLSGQQIFCCNSGCGCQKRQSLIITQKNSFVWHMRPSLWLPTSPAGTTGGKTLQKASLFPGFSYLYVPSNPLILKKHQHPSPHYRDQSFT